MAKRSKSTADPAHVVAYVRCSTDEQAASGAGIAAQRAAIEAEADRRGWTIVEWCSDAGLSGKSLDRPGLGAALDAVDTGRAAGIVVSKLDRLSRSLADFASIMVRAQAEGWNLVALDLGVDLSTPAGRFLAGVVASAAQWEREIIGSRTKDALAARKAEGVTLGRPRVLPDDVRTRITAEHAAGRTLAAIARDLEADEIPTARGGARWWPSTVRSIVHAEQPEESR